MPSKPKQVILRMSFRPYRRIERVSLASPLLEAKFPFIRDDIFLVAQVEVETGKQTLRMQYVNLATRKILLEDALDCIHAAICDIPVNKFAEVSDREDFEEKILQIRSSEQLKEINLAPEEKFLAFKSWVAGIAEAGMNAFEIQGEIDAAARLQYPITNRLLRFLARVDSKFISTYMDYVDRNASHEGVRHRAYLVASLLPILEGLVQEPKIPNGAQVLQMIFALEPPFELFNNSWPLFRKLAEYYPGFLTQYLARVKEEYQKKRGGGDEWLLVVLCPVLDAFDWTGASGDAQRGDLWKQIQRLDPPPELFSAYGTLFRYFTIKDPEFLPQYMRRVRQERASNRAHDDTWLITVLRPVFVALDHMGDRNSSGISDLWQDLLLLNPPFEFLLENWKTIWKLMHNDPGILYNYVAWVRRLYVDLKIGNRALLVTTIRPALEAFISINDMESNIWAKIKAEILMLDLPAEAYPNGWKK